MKTKSIIVGIACVTGLCAVGFLIGYCQHRKPTSKFADNLEITGLILDTSRTFGTEPGYNVRDTIWEGRVYVEKTHHKPVDTMVYAPSFLPINGEEAEVFWGDEKDLIAYAERKRIRKFCYKKANGVQMFIRLKENENYQLASARHGVTGPAMVPNHREGWSTLWTDMGHWTGDTLIYGETIFMGCDDRAMIPCVYSDVFRFDNTPLKRVLDEFAAYRHFTISNPGNVEGMSVTGIMNKNEAMETICDMLTRIESGAVAVHFDKGVVFVSETPFSQHQK